MSRVIGIGVDLVDVPRFARSIGRRPGLVDRLLREDELSRADGTMLGPASLAGRFAAKEAVAKALGAPPGLSWHDVRVADEGTGRPTLQLSGATAFAAAEIGVAAWHLSLSHDGDNVIAFVVAEGSN